MILLDIFNFFACPKKMFQWK